MDVISAPTQYATALQFATEVTDAVTLPEHGTHGELRLLGPYIELQAKDDWSWCDNVMDVDLVAARLLRGTVEYVTLRHALSTSTLAARPIELWSDLAARVALLREALEFAAAAAEDAWRLELDIVLMRWIRDRLARLLAPPTPELRLPDLEVRVRHSVVICHRYRHMRYDLFGDRHWNGRPLAPWRSPDTDLAVRAPRRPSDGDHFVGTQALRVGTRTDHGLTATFTVSRRRDVPRAAPITVEDGVLTVPEELAGDPRDADAVREALETLGHGITPSSGR